MMRLITVLIMLFFMTPLLATDNLQQTEEVVIPSGSILLEYKGARRNIFDSDKGDALVPAQQKVLKAPEKLVINFRLLQRSIELHHRGEVLRRVGVGLVIPATIFAVVSVVSIGMGVTLFGDSYVGSLSPAFLIPGILGLIANTFIIIAGASRISQGKAMIRRAEKMKKRAHRVAFKIIPLISPKSKSYGVMLSLNY